MKEQKQYLSFRPFTFGLSLFLLLFISSSCQKEEVTTRSPYVPVESRISLATYEVQDVYQGQPRTYELGLHQIGDYYEFCNFAGLRINVKAYINGESIEIPPQIFSRDNPTFLDFEIIYGTGKLTSDHLEIEYRARDGQQYVKHEIKAELLK